MANFSGYDGSVRIDSRMDTGGFNAGIKKMMGAVGKLGAAIGIAFGVAAIIDFGKQSVDAAAKAEASLKGLQAVVEANGRSFAQANRFIKQYTEDGLVSASAAAQAYKDMVSRGYDTSQIEQMLQIMKDAAVYNRQAGFTMDEAITRTAQGLRMENSLLTDSAGIQKNVAKMWQEYAKSIGTTANNLTDAQKRQAEFNGFVAEGGIYAGNAAQYMDTYGGRLAQLSASFLNLRVAVGNSIIPVISRVLPYIKAAVDALTRWFNRIALIMSILFGVDISAQAQNAQNAMSGMADATNAAADAQQNLADSTAAAGKAAKGALASFDDLNVLQQKDEGGGSGAGAGAGLEALTGGGLPDTLSTPALDTSETDAGLEALRNKIEGFKQTLASWFEPMRAPLTRLGEAFRGLGQTIMEGLGWAWANILRPIFEWVTKSFAPVAIDLLATAVETLNTILEVGKPSFQAFYDDFLKPVGEWTGGVIIDFLKWLNEQLIKFGNWAKENPEDLQRIIELVIALGVAFTAFATLGKIATIIGGIIGTIAKLGGAIKVVFAIISAIVGAIGGVWIAIGVAIVAIVALIITQWDSIVGLWEMFSDWFYLYVITPLKANWIMFWNGVKEKAANAWQWIKDKWQGAKDWFNTKVLEPIKKAFKTAGEWIGDKFGAALNGIKGVAADVVNWVIRMLNKIQISIPDWVPGLGGKKWGVNIQEVSWGGPALASGGVIAPNSPRLVMVGDHRTQREIIAPEDMIRRIVREEAAENQKNSVPQTIDNRIYWGGREIYREIKRIERQQGGSLLAGAGI